MNQEEDDQRKLCTAHKQIKEFFSSLTKNVSFECT